MMKKLSILVSILIFSSMTFAGLTKVYYTAENVSGNQWVYNYTIINLALTEGIKEFTIWFDHGKYASIQRESDPTLDKAWDQVTWQPNESLQNNGGFDVLALAAPIEIGDSGVSGFAVYFLWSGTGNPGRQFFEVVNPDNTSQVLDSGYTIPEPTSLILLIGSSICLALKRRITTSPVLREA